MCCEGIKFKFVSLSFRKKILGNANLTYEEEKENSLVMLTSHVELAVLPPNF